MSDSVVIVTAPQTILIVAGGQQGPQGPQGDQGEPGPPGGAADLGAGAEAELIVVNAAGTAFSRAGQTLGQVQSAIAGKEPAGSAAAAVAAHEAAPDPHPQYATSAEVASAIATKLDDLPAGTADAIVTAGADGTALGRAVHTIASLLAAARDRASHTGSQLASTISDFAAQVLALLSWGNISGKPSTFPPESHTHVAAQVSDSTATGRAVMTAADAAAARTAIGAESAGAAAAAVSAHEAALDPHTQYTTAAEAAAAAPVQSVAGRTGAVTLSTSDVSGLGGAATLNVGTTAGTVAAGDDARLSDARTPTAHASSHGAGSSDPIAPADIGATPTTRAINTTGLATGGGNLSADRTITVLAASAADVNGGTSTTAAMTPGSYKDSTPFFVTRGASADHTLVLSDANVDQGFDSSSDRVLNIPANSSVAFPLYTKIPVIRLGSGTVTIDAPTGVTLNGVNGGSCTISTRYQGALLTKTGTDAWVVSGDVSAVA